MHSEELYNDLELLELLKEGNQHAFTQIYDRYWDRLFDHAYKRIANREQAEDIVQNLFVRIWIRRESLSINNLSAYLFTALRYSLLDFITRTKPVESFYEPFEAIIGDAEMPDHLLIAKNFMDIVYSYADTLPQKKKEIFLLHIKNKLTTKEIAANLGITQKTVQNQLRLALQGLRAHLAALVALLISIH